MSVLFVVSFLMEKHLFKICNKDNDKILKKVALVYLLLTLKWVFLVGRKVATRKTDTHNASRVFVFVEGNKLKIISGRPHLVNKNMKERKFLKFRGAFKTLLNMGGFCGNSKRLKALLKICKIHDESNARNIELLLKISAINTCRSANLLVCKFTDKR